MKRTHKDLEINQENTSLSVFMGEYNVTIPASFPHATIKILKHFQTTHPALFNGIDTWSIDKHRKRFMDWALSHREAE